MAENRGIAPDRDGSWYAGITGYQWLVLAIASAGWIFDVYEGQVFNITRNQMLSDILHGNAESVAQYGDFFLGLFLLGGTVGGLAAGSLADKYGRQPIMIVTILLYSIFSGLTYFATELWHVAGLRFLVALGVGGEWAVAASMVSEVFPPRARAQASGIFHASSVLGTWMAALAGWMVGAQWQYAYLVGVLPALLILLVRGFLREPEQWKAKAVAAREKNQRGTLGSFQHLLTINPWKQRAWAGLGLAMVGLGTFWAVSVAGQDIARQMLVKEGVSNSAANEQAKIAYGFVQTAGGGAGLLAFGPLSARIGRRRTFIWFHVLAFLIVPATCYGPQTYQQLLWVLPIFGFFTLGMHAGYAIYFPELFPSELRATGASFCFNGGRVAAVPILLLSGWLKSNSAISLQAALSGMGCLYMLGCAIVLVMPETNQQELPE